MIWVFHSTSLNFIKKKKTQTHKSRENRRVNPHMSISQLWQFHSKDSYFTYTPSSRPLLPLVDLKKPSHKFTRKYFSTFLFSTMLITGKFPSQNFFHWRTFSPICQVISKRPVLRWSKTSQTLVSHFRKEDALAQSLAQVPSCRTRPHGPQRAAPGLGNLLNLSAAQQWTKKNLPAWKAKSLRLHCC